MSTKPISSPSLVSSTEIVAIDNTNASSSTSITTTPNQKSVNEAITKPISSNNHSKPKSSFWGFPCPRKANRQISEPKPTDNKKVNYGHTNSTNGHDEAQVLRNWIDADLNFIKKSYDTIDKYKNQIEEASCSFEKLKNGGSRDDFRELKKTVTKLKQQISSKDKDESTRSNGPGGKGKGGNAKKSLDEMPNLYKNQMFECSSAFQDFQLLYDGLETELKLCLLCFSVFPENAIIKKRLMVYWWIGEGFIRGRSTPGSEKTTEDLGNEFFKELMMKGFIQPFYEKRSLEVHSCKMHPFVRSAVIMLAEKAKFFDFDQGEENVTGNFSGSLRACLAGKGLINIQELEHLHMVFNVNEPSIEFKLEWFLKMINVNVLYLGRWQASATHHIEVDDTKFLEGLMNMKHLRFFSLQGVSRITELPESISGLGSLTILDLRACHSLEVIPDGIGSLKSLTHLDMSECYLLDQMPKGLASLSQLQVLKGFVVGESKGKNSCTLDDLAKLRKLKKLCVYTGLKHFPKNADLHAFQQFKVLCKLTIAWGRGSLEDETDKSAKQVKDAAKSTANILNQENRGGNTMKGNSTAAQATAASDKPSHGRPVLRRLDAFKPQRDWRNEISTAALPSGLEKLDLQCYPRTISPSWLMPANLKHLKKLYIRGGKFSDLGQFQDKGGILMPEANKWGVEVLRLKYLNELEMDWRELQELFPKLIYLEKVQCPKLAFFPCDERGVWINRTKKSKQLQEIAP